MQWCFFVVSSEIRDTDYVNFVIYCFLFLHKPLKPITWALRQKPGGGGGGEKKKEKPTYRSKGSNPAISTAAQISRVNALQVHRSVRVHGAAGQEKCCLGRGETTRPRAKVVFSRVCFPSFNIVAPRGQMDSFTLSVDRLRRSPGFCLDMYQTSRACVTKLSMVAHHNQLDCHVKRSICCRHGHREGL